MVTLERRAFEESDLDSHIALARTQYSDPTVTDPDLLRWKFLACPEGAAQATMLKADGALVGRSMRQQRTFMLQPDEPLKGASISDVLLAPSFRRADLLIRLIKAGSDLSDVDLILHGSNEFSDPIYRKLFKYPVVFSLKGRGFPVRVAGLLRKLTGLGPRWIDALAWPWRAMVRAVSWVIGRLARVDLAPGALSADAYAGIFEGFEKIAGPHFRRDAAFARWRFEAGPIFNARVLKLTIDGRLVGYVAMRLVEFGGIRMNVVVDIAVGRPLSGFERLALALKMAAAGSSGRADVVVTLANFDNPILRGAFGFPFFHIPESLLPHASPMFALLNGDKAGRLSLLGSTFMTLADMDYF